MVVLAVDVRNVMEQVGFQRNPSRNSGLRKGSVIVAITAEYPTLTTWGTTRVLTIEKGMAELVPTRNMMTIPTRVFPDKEMLSVDVERASNIQTKTATAFAGNFTALSSVPGGPGFEHQKSKPRLVQIRERLLPRTSHRRCASPRPHQPTGSAS